MNSVQQQVQEAIDGLVASGVERGLQVVAYRHGEPVVDAVAGVADHETRRPLTPETPIYVYSVGKGATATVAHVLVERGAFDYDTPIVELWPEFGAHGKGGATVRHALTHTVGVPGIPADTTPEDLCDWDGMCAFLTDDVLHDLNQGARETGRAAFRAFLARMNQSYREQLRDIVVMAGPRGRAAAVTPRAPAPTPRTPR